MRTVYKPIPTYAYNPLSPTPPAGLGLSIQEDEFEQAVVTDVITNDTHDLYSKDGYNVGMVQFQLRSDDLIPTDRLAWANPLFSNITEYPLRGELVYIFHSMKRWWYLTKFNVSNRVTTQNIPELLNENKPQKTQQDISNNYTSKSPAIKFGNKTDSDIAGRYFKDIPSVHRLKHTEGDFILEGRSGASIRFGTSWLDGTTSFLSSTTDQSPNILIRVGADPQAKLSVNTPFGLVLEDINRDASSIWVVSDQVVDLDFATKNSKIHGISVKNFPKTLTGNQLVLNTDRFVVNAKTDTCIISAAKGIHLTSLQNITLDSDGDQLTWTIGKRTDNVVGNWTRVIGGKYNTSVKGDVSNIAGGNQLLTAKGKMDILAKKIHIGADTSTEPLVLGKTLQDFLHQLIDALVSGPLVLITSRPGGPSQQNPTRIAKLKQLQSQFLSGRIISDDNFTTKKNTSGAAVTDIQPYKVGT